VHRRIDAPVFISLEHASECNYRCSYCPQSITPLDPEKKMAGRTFDRVLSRLAKYKWHGILEWGFFNEPSLDTRLRDWIYYMSYAVAPWHQWIYSNGSWLNKPNAGELVFNWAMSGLDTLCVSTHGQDEVTMRDKLIAATRSAQLSGCRPKRVILRTIGEGSTALNNRATLSLHRASQQKRTRCFLHHMIIRTDGRVAICVMDYHGEKIVGDLNNQSLDEVWRSYADLRKELARGDFRNAPSLCERCYEGGAFSDEVIQCAR
jgi:2-deoxy-scyllo-inosamine dehydrogenase (SAM-dependent)